MTESNEPRVMFNGKWDSEMSKEELYALVGCLLADVRGRKAFIQVLTEHRTQSKPLSSRQSER